jgi:hypothetical protein
MTQALYAHMNKKKKRMVIKAGMVAQACNPNSLNGRDWEHHSARPLQAKSLQDHISTKKNWVWCCMPVIPATYEA